MNKSVLAAFALASFLSACSSQPSDNRPSSKVSVDAIAPGTRETDVYNLNGQEEASHDGHGHNAAGHEVNSQAADTTHRKDVMINHDEHATDVDAHEEVPAEEKTVNSDHSENHE